MHRASLRRVWVSPWNRVVEYVVDLPRGGSVLPGLKLLAERRGEMVGGDVVDLLGCQRQDRCSRLGDVGQGLDPVPRPDLAPKLFEVCRHRVDELLGAAFGKPPTDTVSE